MEKILKNKILVDNLKNIFKNLVNKINEEGFYSDFVYYSSNEKRIFVDKENVETTKDRQCGIKIRIWDGFNFLESSFSNLEESNIKFKALELLKKAKNNLKDNSKLKSSLVLNVDREVINSNWGLNSNLTSLNLEELISKLKVYRDKILNYSKDIVTVKTVIGEEIEETIFVNSYKTLYQVIPLSFLAYVSYINSNGSVKTVYKSFVAENCENVFKKADSNFHNYFSLIKNYQKANKLKGGKYKVILSPQLSGLLAHESFGHGMEADTILRDRAFAKNFIGKKIAPNFISIVDYPLLIGKNGYFYFDCEGNLAKKTYLVKNGILNDPMSDIFSSSKLGLNLTGNSRFQSFDHKNYVRMSNTYFEGGVDTFEELISNVDEGIFIINSMGGMEDPKSWSVQIQNCFGQKILNGKLVEEYYDGFTLTGFLLDIMNSIGGISKKVEIEGGGSCGKGHKEWVRVSEGGPYMLIGEVILG